LPFTLMSTVMCFVLSSSNGTATGLTSLRSSARAGRATSRSSTAVGVKRFMLQALPRLDGHVPLLVALGEREVDVLAGSQRPGRLRAAGPVVDVLAVKAGDAVPRLDAGPVRGALLQHPLDHDLTVALGQLQSEEAAGDDLRFGPLAQQAAEHLERGAHRV